MAASPNATNLSEARSVAARMDALPLTRLHRLVLLFCMLGLAFDVVESALGNALSAIFSSPPHRVDSEELSWLLASVFAGGAIGAPLFGLLSDRRGRRIALGGSLTLLGATSLAAATSVDIWQLTIFRAMSGLAIGAYPPLMVAYLSDVLPPKRRGAMIMLVGAVGFLGAPAVILLIRWLTPLQPFGIDGWRWALTIGAIGAASVGLAFRFLPESPRWLASVDRTAEALQICDRFERAAGGRIASTLTVEIAQITDLQQSAPIISQGHKFKALVLCALYFLSPWATIGFPLLSGAVLIQKGYQLDASLTLVGLSMLGPSIGVLASLMFIDRIDRRSVLALSAGGMIVSAAAFAVAEEPTPLIIAGLGFNLIGSIYIGALSIYAAELFPTGLRGALSAGAWSVNRIASALAPLALLPLLQTAGSWPMIAAIMAALGASIAVVLLFGQRGLSRSSLG